MAHDDDGDGGPSARTLAATQERHLRKLQQAVIDLEDREGAWRAQEKVCIRLPACKDSTPAHVVPNSSYALMNAHRRCVTRLRGWNATSGGLGTTSSTCASF